MPKVKGTWYYTTDIDSFGGFYYAATKDDVPRSTEKTYYGPFATFGEAKEDALGYHRCTIIEAKACLDDIRKTRKPSTN